MDRERAETFDERKEGLRAIFTASLEVFQNPDRRLEEGAITVVRRTKSGERETNSGLIVLGISEDGVEIAGIEEDGNPSDSLTLGWEEIADAIKE